MPSKRVLHLRRLRATLSLLLFCIVKSAKGFFWLPSLSSLSSSSYSRLSPKMTDTNKQTTKSSSSLSSTTSSSKSLLSDIHDAIELVTQPHDTIQQQLKHKFGLTLRQIVNWEDNDVALVDGLGDKKILVENDHKKLALPLHFCLSLNGVPVEEDDDNRVTLSSSSPFHGLVTFYMAYSTWEGRMLYVDHLSIINPNTSEDNKRDRIADIELLVLQSLARIAIHLNCARLMWRTTKELPSSSALLNSIHSKPETLEEILTLYLDRTAMERYISRGGGGDNQVEQAIIPLKTDDGNVWNHQVVQSSIMECLNEVNESPSPSSSSASLEEDKSEFRIRLATKDDLTTITKLVQGLADYVKESDAVYLTAEDYLRDGFSDHEEPLFYFLLMDRRQATNESNDDDWIPCGYAAYYFGYEIGSSEGGGRFLYLEDLFIEEEHRKIGGGSLMMQTLSQIALSLQCSRFYWQALDWNTAGLNFYKKIGATIQQGVITRRYCGDSLRKFASVHDDDEDRN